MDAAWTQPSIVKNFRAPHGRAPKNSEPLMDTAFHFQDFEAPHGRALKISEPLMGAALKRPSIFEILKRHMVAP